MFNHTLIYLIFESKNVLILKSMNGGENVTIYVQATGSDTWHWCMNCSKFPTSIIRTRTTRPAGNLCEECKANEKNGNCF